MVSVPINDTHGVAMFVRAEQVIVRVVAAAHLPGVTPASTEVRLHSVGSKVDYVAGTGDKRKMEKFETKSVSACTRTGALVVWNGEHVT